MYFRKSEGSVIKGSWTLGLVEAVKRGMDGLIREATVKYCNASEDIPRYTDRSIRSLVRLFNVMDGHWRQDMEQVQRLLNELKVEAKLENSDDNNIQATHEDPTLCSCCCASHCSLSLHVS